MSGPVWRNDALAPCCGGGTDLAKIPDEVPMLTRIAPLLFLLALLPGCFFEPVFEGDSSPGELGRTRWRIVDGLCPGLGGNCALDVPVAVGARILFGVDGVDGVPLTASVTGALVADGPVDVSEDGGDSYVHVRAASAGTGVIEISDASGLVDRVRITVREASRLECGSWPRGEALGWRMEGLSPASSLTLPVGMDDVPSLACRASDATGPLLSRDAIHWRITEGHETVLDIHTDGLDFTDDGEADGARIRYDGLAPGAAHVTVTLGAVTEELSITVE